jgi:hypothetical protein
MAHLGWPNQWIGFLGEIETGNQSYFPMIHMGLKPVKIFPVKTNPLTKPFWDLMILTKTTHC